MSSDFFVTKTQQLYGECHLQIKDYSPDFVDNLFREAPRSCSTEARNRVKKWFAEESVWAIPSEKHTTTWDVYKGNLRARWISDPMHE